MNMTEEQFNIIKQAAANGVDETVAFVFDTTETRDEAIAFIQISGSRMLATLIGSAMAEKNLTFEQAFEGVKSGLRKESIGVFQEIHRGERQGV